MEKKLYIVGNWKMYKTAREATDYIEALLPQIQDLALHVYLAVPFTSIASAAHYAKETPILIGAQNMNDAREGAFTGEIAGLMLKEAGAAFVLLGHSERRHIFGESNAFIRKKVLRALQDDIQPILCVGETEREKEATQTEEVLKEQIFSALQDVPKEEAAKLLIAYEPVWAIGKGKIAETAHVREAHAICRHCLVEIFGKRVGGKIPILYGGSVKPTNIEKIVAEDNVEGVLVGGASLDPETFAEIARQLVKSPKKSPSPKKTARIKKEKKE